eukprot:1003707_1
MSRYGDAYAREAVNPGTTVWSSDWSERYRHPSLEVAAKEEEERMADMLQDEVSAEKEMMDGVDLADRTMRAIDKAGRDRFVTLDAPREFEPLVREATGHICDPTVSVEQGRRYHEAAFRLTAHNANVSARVMPKLKRNQRECARKLQAIQTSENNILQMQKEICSKIDEQRVKAGAMQRKMFGPKPSVMESIRMRLNPSKPLDGMEDVMPPDVYEEARHRNRDPASSDFRLMPHISHYRGVIPRPRGVFCEAQKSSSSDWRCF